MGHVKVDTLSRTGVSDKTLHPSIFVWKGILLILLLFQKNMHYWLKGMWNLANNV